MRLDRKFRSTCRMQRQKQQDSGGAAQTHSQGRKRGESEDDVEDEDESRNIDAGCRRRKLCCAPVVVACLGICCGSRHTLAHPKWLPLVLLSCKFFLHPRPRVPSACVCWCACECTSSQSSDACVKVSMESRIQEMLIFFACPLGTERNFTHL